MTKTLCSPQTLLIYGMLFMLLLCLCAGLHAQNNFTGGAGTDEWNDVPNWDNGILPGPDNLVSIDNFNVVLSNGPGINAEVETLTLSNSTTLSLDNSATLAFDSNGNGTPTFTVEGTSNVFFNSAQVTGRPDLVLNTTGQFVIAAGQRLEVNTIDLQSGVLEVRSGGMLVVHEGDFDASAAGVLVHADFTSLVFLSTSAASTLDLGAGGAIISNLSLGGTGSWRLGSDVQLNELLEVSTTLELSDGTPRSLSAGSVEFSDGILRTLGGTLETQGDFSFDGNSVLDDSAGGEIRFEGGGSASTQDITLNANFMSVAATTTFHGNWDITALKPTTSFGTVVVESSAGSTTPSTSLTISATDPVQILGDLTLQTANNSNASLDISNASLQLTGNLTLDSAGGSGVAQAQFLQGGSFSGSVSSDATSSLNLDGTFTFSGSGNFNVPAGLTANTATLNFSSNTGPHTLEAGSSLGSLTISGTTTTTSVRLGANLTIENQLSIQNRAQLQCLTFDLTVNAGTVGVSGSGALLDLGSGTHTIAASTTLSQLGVLHLQSSDTTFQENLSIDAILDSGAAGSLTFDAASIALNSSVSGASTADLPATTIADGTTLSLSGIFECASLDIGSGAGNAANLVLRNNSTLELDADSGTITVASNGSITTTGGNLNVAPEIIRTNTAAPVNMISVAGTLDVDGLKVTQDTGGGATSMVLSPGASLTNFNNLRWRWANVGNNGVFLSFETDHDTGSGGIRFRGHDFGDIREDLGGIIVSADDSGATAIVIDFVNFLYDRSTNPATGDIALAQSDDRTVNGSETIRWIGDFSWEGSVSSDWNTAGNWSGGNLPSSTDDVTIPDVTQINPAFVFPNLSSGTISVASLVLEANALLTVDSGAILEVGNDGIEVDGTLTISGTLRVSGDITLNAQVLGNGTLESNGGIDAQLAGTSATLQTAHFMLTKSSGFGLTLNVPFELSAGSLDVASGSTLTLSTGAAHDHRIGGELNISGDIVDGGANLTLEGSLDVAGTLNFTTGDFILEGTNAATLSGSGSLSLTNLRVNKANSAVQVTLARNLSLTQDLILTRGLFDIDSFTIDVQGANLMIASQASLDLGSGILTFSGTSYTIDGAQIPDAGNVRFTGTGSISVTGNGNLDFNELEVSLANSGDSLTFGDAFDLQGDLTLMKGTLDLGTFAHQLAGSLLFQVVNPGDLSLNQSVGGNLHFDGATQVIDSAGTVSPNLTLEAITIESGSTTSLQTQLQVETTFTVRAGGRFNLESAAELQIGVSSAGTFLVEAGAAFFASGTQAPSLHGPNATNPMACTVLGELTLNNLDISFYDNFGLNIGVSAKVLALNNVAFHDAQTTPSGVHLSFLADHRVSGSDPEFINCTFDNTPGFVWVRGDGASNTVNIRFGASVPYVNPLKQEDNGATIDFGTVSAATLAINPAATNPASEVLRSIGQDNVVLGVFALQAMNNSVLIDALTLHATISGTTTQASSLISALRLIRDDNQNGQVDLGEAQVGSDQVFPAASTSLSFSGSPLLVVNQGPGLHLLVVADFSGNDSLGALFSVAINSNSDATVGANVTVSGAFPTTSASSRAVDTLLTLREGANSPAAQNASPGDTSIELYQLSLTGTFGVNTLNGITVSILASNPSLLVGIDVIRVFQDDNANGLVDPGEPELVGGGKTFSSTSFEADLTFNLPMTINLGQVVNLLFVLDSLNTTTLHDKELRISFDSSDLDVSGEVTPANTTFTSQILRFPAPGLSKNSGSSGGGCAFDASRQGQSMLLFWLCCGIGGSFLLLRFARKKLLS